jgi:hypothetical protein
MAERARSVRRCLGAVTLAALVWATVSVFVPTPALAAYSGVCAGASELPGAFPDAGLAADCLKKYGISVGKADGTFGETDALLRSQASSLVLRFLALGGIVLTDSKDFVDVNPGTVPNDLVRRDIELLAGSGIVAGFPDGGFHPGDNLTVAQATTLVVRMLQLIHAHAPSVVEYQDKGSTSANYEYALQRGLLDPNAVTLTGAAYPHQASDVIERGLLADVLAQALQQLADSPPPPTTSPPTTAPPPPPDCTPGYDPCIPPGDDVDCLGGGGNGPRYVQGPVIVTGDDPYGLDTDHDGIGCES